MMASTTTNNTSPWTQPESTAPQTGLVINNSMTKSKVPFIARDGKHVSWYTCGPTVYDSAHIGHARTYVGLDIIRRIMEDYFKYDVNLVMNVTDIDDKIILGARRKHLLEQYLTKSTLLDNQVIQDVENALYTYATANFKESINSDDEWTAFAARTPYGSSKFNATTDDEAKRVMRFKAASATFAALAVARRQLSGENQLSGKDGLNNLLDASKDVMAEWLDSQFHAQVTDHHIFRDLAAQWEKSFFEDMDTLNVRRPHVLTRVSEFVPEIVKFVERIVENGYAYEAEGSVYFDVTAFDGKDGHFYAKLMPASKGNQELVDDAEGALGGKLTGKRNKSDFALWKKSKPGEPAWPSPWGPGRPGWHIECSVMASDILGEQIDIHAGGIDLAFPHHDNELAQSEACFNCKQWVNYFLHTGHLHIDGLKMSKSLKNFISIKEALKMYTPRQLRILFLLSNWSMSTNYQESTLSEVIAIEKTFNNFFANSIALLRDFRTRRQDSDGKRHFLEQELRLMEDLKETNAQVHNALLDSFDTPTAMRALQDIIASTNIYMQRGREDIDPQLIEMVARYVTQIVQAFGLIEENSLSQIGWKSSSSSSTDNQASAIDRESILLPLANVISDFRDAVRDKALSGGGKKALLELCDELRDKQLPDLGIVLDDRGDGRALVKFANPEELRREREAREAEEKAKREKKEAAARAAEAKRQERLARGKLAPQDMFRTPEMMGLYSEWNEKGVPTKDKAGEGLSKGKIKKLTKEHDAQAKLHAEYLKSLDS